MKKLLIIVTVALITCSVNAQSLQGYLKAGANMGKISGQSFQDNFTLAYHAGVALEIGLNKKIALQPEVLFNQTQTTTTSFNGTFTPNKDAQLNYLSIPLLLQIKPSKYVSLHVGPEYSILMNKDSSLYSNGKQAIKSGNFSVVGGLQFNFGTMKLYGRYNIGLSNINNLATTSEWKTQTIQVGLAYNIF